MKGKAKAIIVIISLILVLISPLFPVISTYKRGESTILYGFPTQWLLYHGLGNYTFELLSFLVSFLFYFVLISSIYFLCGKVKVKLRKNN